jgi:hypothetical protein
MSTLKTLKNKHLLIDRQLTNEWERIMSESKPKFKIAAKIAAKYDLSTPTVANYATGNGSDGFLKEIILEELKEY